MSLPAKNFQFKIFNLKFVIALAAFVFLAVILLITINRQRLSFPQVKGAKTTTFIQSKILLVIFNPIIESKGSRKLTSVFGWNNPDTLTQQYIEDINDASGGGVSYSIGQKIEVDDFPSFQNGFDYTDQSYLDCINDHSKCYTSSFVDYNRIFSDLGICSILNNSKMSEVWFFSGPFIGFYEWNARGPSLNLYTENIPNCGKTVYVMGFNYERTVTEMLHDFGHRTETIMAYSVFETWRNSNTLWDKFDGQYWRYNYKIGDPQPAVATTGTHCGDVHFPANVNSHYDYTNTLSVSSDCDDWYNFPNLTGATKTANCSTWGCDHRGFLKWWLTHLPKAEGQTDGKYNNWWRYLVDWDNSLPKTTAAIINNPPQMSCDSQGRVNAKFSWTPASSTNKTLSMQWLDLSLANNNFASGTFLSTSNPPSSSDSQYLSSTGRIGTLAAGKTHFWRINSHFQFDPWLTWYPSETAMFTTPDCIVAEQKPSPTPTASAQPTPTATPISSSCDNFAIDSVLPNPVEVNGKVTVKIASSAACSGKKVWILNAANSQWVTCFLNSQGNCQQTLTAPSSVQTTTIWAVLDLNGDSKYDNGGGTFGDNSEYRRTFLTVIASTGPSPNPTPTPKPTPTPNSTPLPSSTPTPIPTPSPTPQIAAAQLQGFPQLSCNSQRRVDAIFKWTKASGKTIDAQWLDLSLFANNFAKGTFLGTNNPPYTSSASYTTGTGGIGPLDPAKPHYWRINTHFLGDNAATWYPSATGVFTTPRCGS